MVSLYTLLWSLLGLMFHIVWDDTTGGKVGPDFVGANDTVVTGGTVDAGGTVDGIDCGTVVVGANDTVITGGTVAADGVWFGI